MEKSSWHQEKVFPTPVGVFLYSVGESGALVSLPHARGGVSLSDEHPNDNGAVFPTPVGVFLRLLMVVSPRWSLPHVRIPAKLNSHSGQREHPDP